MNKTQRVRVGEIISKLEDVRQELEELSQEEQDKFDNLSEGLQQTEKGEELSKGAEDFADFARTLEELSGDLFDYS
jgi:response regulator of citrate/malate metabolism